MPAPIRFPSPAIAPEREPLLTIRDCCKDLKVGRTKFHALRQSREFPLPVDMPGHPRWTRAAIERWKHRPLTHTYARLVAGGRR